MRTLTVIAALTAGFILATAVQAASGWKTFATGSDQGEYGAYVSANADVLSPGAVGVRASQAAKVSWTIICDGETTVAAGQVVKADVGSAKRCSVFGHGSTDKAGKLKVDLLRR